MAVHRIRPDQLAGALRKEARKAPRALRKGMRAAALRGKTRLIAATNEKDKVYLSQFKNSFQVVREGRGWTLLNDAPHAGIIELGARPHPVSADGVDAIRRWVAKKIFGISVELLEQNEHAEAVVWASVNRIKREGQKPTYLFRDELPKLQRYLREEVERCLKAEVG